MPGGVDNIIKYCNEAGISSIELMSGDVEADLGAPKNPMQGMMGPRPPAHLQLHRLQAPRQPPRRCTSPRRSSAASSADTGATSSVDKYNQDLKAMAFISANVQIYELGKKIQ